MSTRIPYGELLQAALKDPDFRAKHGAEPWFELAELGDFVFTLRQNSNLGVGELAAKAGVARTILWQIENGQGNPRFSTLVKLAHACGYSLILRAERAESEVTP